MRSYRHSSRTSEDFCRYEVSKRVRVWEKEVNDRRRARAVHVSLNQTPRSSPLSLEIHLGGTDKLHVEMRKRKREENGTKIWTLLGCTCYTACYRLLSPRAFVRANFRYRLWYILYYTYLRVTSCWDGTV